MKTIFCVLTDWAHNGETGSNVLACFTDMDKAIAYLNEAWEAERKEEYTKKYDQTEERATIKEMWVDGEYYDEHFYIAIVGCPLFGK